MPMFIMSVILLVYLGIIYPILALYGARQLHVREPVSLFIRVVATKAMDEYKEDVYWFGGMGTLLVCWRCFFDVETLTRYCSLICHSFLAPKCFSRTALI